MKRKSLMTICLALAAIIIAVAFYLVNRNGRSNAEIGGDMTSSQQTASSKLDTVNYDISYKGRNYNKTAVVYVPDSYKAGTPMNILYLMHGSHMSGTKLAQDLQPQLDNWLADKPMLVVFPTYYPDSSFVVSNYTEDYPLNHFFASDEIDATMQAVEGQFTTYAGGTTEADFEQSRTHRAFGGYSMGGITTWDVLVEKPQYFHAFMPMAGDSWINRSTGGSGDDDTANTLVSGLSGKAYGPNDFSIVAMVGENDGTKSSMVAQIEALRRNHGNLINDNNLVYWENHQGGHNMDSFAAEVEHGIPYLFVDR